MVRRKGSDSASRGTIPDLAIELYSPPTTPTSDLADQIFNDPDSWKRETRTGVDFFEHEKFPATAVGSAGFTSAEFKVKPFKSKYKLTLRPESTPPGYYSAHTPESDSETLWEGVQEDGERSSPLMSFLEHTGKDLKDVKRLSMLWSHGNIFRTLPSPIMFTPTSSNPLDSSVFPIPPRPTGTLRISTRDKSNFPSPRSASDALSPLRLASAFKVTLNSPLTSMESPGTVVSASATWSILEWYGAQDIESPRKERGTPTPFPPTPCPQQQRDLPSSNLLLVSQTAHDVASVPYERGRVPARAPAPAATAAGKPAPIMISLSTPSMKGSPALSAQSQSRAVRPLPTIPGSSTTETPVSAPHVRRRLRSNSTPRSLPPTPVMRKLQRNAASVS